MVSSEKGPKAGDSGSRAGREGGAKSMTREDSPEAAVRLGVIEGQRRDVQLVPAGLHAEAGAAFKQPGTDAPFVAPKP